MWFRWPSQRKRISIRSAACVRAKLSQSPSNTTNRSRTSISSLLCKGVRMPCYIVQTMTVDLKFADMGLLKKALTALKLQYAESGKGLIVYTPSGNITIADGKAKYSDGTDGADYINKIKKQYSLEVVTHLSKKYKFT